MSKTLATGMLEQLRNNIYRIAPALYVDGVWTVDDLDGANQELRNATDLLHRCGAIQKEGTVHINEQQGMRRISQWRWTDTRLQGKLQAFHAERDTMPCGREGHEPHIWNEPSVDGLSCKHCVEEGRVPEYSKEQIRELL